MATAKLTLPTEYGPFLEDLKDRIRSAQLKASVAVNHELVLLYWQIGCQIRAAQNAQGWGAKVIDQLSGDLVKEFPGSKGYSPRNLKYMRAFAEAWPDEPIVQEALAQLTWYHNLALLEKLDTTDKRLWYARKAVEHGWSRNVLVHQIESNLIVREGKSLTNFGNALTKPQSDLVREITKDPYNFEFLTLRGDAEERLLEQGLVAHMQKFLLELGTGFAFVGNQYHLEVGGDDFYIDLLFYHLKLRCYVVIELKTGKFKPEYAGKLGFYLAAVDDLLRYPNDAPTIGLILCKDRNHLVAEYSLKNTSAPIGVSGYQVTTHLPEAVKDSLPSIETIERELSED